MSSPVDPKIKQALRKKPSDRTPEVRGPQLLPRGVFLFIPVFFLCLRGCCDRLSARRCRASAACVLHMASPALTNFFGVELGYLFISAFQSWTSRDQRWLNHQVTRWV